MRLLLVAVSLMSTSCDLKLVDTNPVRNVYVHCVGGVTYHFGSEWSGIMLDTNSKIIPCKDEKEVRFIYD